jgi:hypothetical protein
MNPTELDAMLARIEDTFGANGPGAAVWAEKLAPMDYATALAAVRAMADETEFPSIAAFQRAYRPAQPAGVVERNGCLFLPGTGWTPCHPDDVDGIPRSETLAELPALEAPPMSEARAKAMIAGMRRRTAQARAAMTGDPVVAGKVDALAAALRMTEEPADA